MAIHGKDAYIAIEDSAATTLRNISPYVTSVEWNQSNDIHDTTTLGAEGHTYRQGLTDGGFTVNGLWDDTASTGSYTVITSLIDLEISVGFEYGPEGNGSGAVKKSGECVLESYSESDPVDDLVTFTATFKITGSVTTGTFT